jgi:hypothetical protein
MCLRCSSTSNLRCGCVTRTLNGCVKKHRKAITKELRISHGTLAKWMSRNAPIDPNEEDLAKSIRYDEQHMDPAGLPALVDAIRHLHGADATWIESVTICETFNQATVWEGEVQVFDLRGHPTAKRAYAWSHATEGTKRRFYAVLHEGPVDSPVKAVRASIVADVKSKKQQ